MVVLGSLAIATLPGAALASNPTFTQVCFSNDQTAAIAVGDFNHDSKLDVAITPGGSDCFPFICFDQFIDVYLGNGDGTFGSPTTLDAINVYQDMAAADLNNDGNLDLVTSQMSVLLGNGDGTFGAAQVYPGGSFAGVAVGDLDRDGFLDVATLTNPNGKGGGDSKYVSVHLNRGDGTFGNPVQYRTGDGNRALASGDVNADGFVDLVTVNGATPNGVSVLLGKGDGKFRMHLDTLVPGFPGRSLGVADFDGNGKQDVVVSAQFGDGVFVLLSMGDGTFGPPTGYPMLGNTLFLKTGDINGDGKSDIVAANFRPNYPSPGGGITVLYGDGTGAFASGGLMPVAYGLGVAVGDYNGDSRTDIVADACVLLNNGSVAAATASRLASPGQPAGPSVLEARISPNPLRDHGTFSFSLPKSGLVSVRLYDVRGRQVRSLLDRTWLPAGSHSVPFNRADAGLNAGVYFYRIESGTRVVAGRMVVMNQ